jgi:hypothetical protein
MGARCVGRQVGIPCRLDDGDGDVAEPGQVLVWRRLIGDELLLFRQRDRNDAGDGSAEPTLTGGDHGEPGAARHATQDDGPCGRDPERLFGAFDDARIVGRQLRCRQRRRAQMPAVIARIEADGRQTQLRDVPEKLDVLAMPASVARREDDEGTRIVAVDEMQAERVSVQQDGEHGLKHDATPATARPWPSTLPQSTR